MAFSRDGSRLSVTRENLDVSIWDLKILQRELAGLGLPRELWQSTPASAPAASPVSHPPVSLQVDRGDLPKPAEWHVYWKFLAWNEAIQAHWADAALDISSSLEQIPEGDVVGRSQLFALRGEYHFRDQDPWTARDALEKALQLDPGSKKAARLLARIHALGPKDIRDPKRVSAMVALMNLAAEPDPMTPVLLGFASIRLGQYSQGQKMLESVTESVPGDQQRKAFAAFGLALAAYRQGNHERAAKAIESAEVLYGQFHSQLSGSERAEFERLKSEVEAEIKSLTPP
jgi:tetratricopeptide (TPR) repeat protein